MHIKSLFSFRNGVSRSAAHESGAGIIVFLMMALVFVPIIAAHAAMLWQAGRADIALPQIAGIVNLIVRAFCGGDPVGVVGRQSCCNVSM